MSTLVGMGAEKKASGKENKEVKDLKAKIAELEKENTDLIKSVEETKKENEGLKAKIAELEKPSNK